MSSFTVYGPLEPALRFRSVFGGGGSLNALLDPAFFPRYTQFTCLYSVYLPLVHSVYLPLLFGGGSLNALLDPAFFPRHTQFTCLY